MQEFAPSRQDQRYVWKSSQQTAQHQADLDGNRRLQDLEESVPDEIAEGHRAQAGKVGEAVEAGLKEEVQRCEGDDGRLPVQVEAEGARGRGRERGVGAREPEIQDPEPEGQRRGQTGGSVDVGSGFEHEGRDGVEGGGGWRVLRDGAAVGLAFATTSTGAGDELGGGLVPERRGEGEVFLVLTRLLRALDVEAVDVEGREVAGAGAVGPGPAEAESGAELFAVLLPSGLDGVDDVCDGPAVDGLRWLEEVVEELGDLVWAQSRG